MQEAAAVRRAPSRTLLAIAATLALLGTLMAPSPATAERWPVWVTPVEAALPSGARVLEALPVARALLVASPVAPAGAALADSPLAWKQLLEPVDLGWDEPVQLDSGVATTGAPATWTTTQGQGAVVALVDTGVAPVPALQGAVAGEIDFSGTGGGDGYGHGTFLASLIAARGSSAPGVAPASLVLSLKVADAEGATDLGRVLSALQWLHGPGQASGIRIAVLALGVDPDTEAGEMLDRATAGLAKQGVLVVTAAGNDAGQLTSPATSTGTFSVGAVDDQGDDDPANDVVADFSGSGHDRLGVPQPDVHAPGVSIVGHIGADSAIANTYPEAFVGDLFRGSGTSMSTALTAGVAALVSSARPDFDGADLDAALRAGDGRLDAPAALAEALAAPSRPGKRPATTPAAAPTPAAKSAGKGNGPADQANPQGVRWVEDHPWDGVRWVDEHWNGVRWVGVRWVGVRWVGVRWVDGHWGDEGWEDAVWGGVRWVGVRWVGVRWVGNGWAGETWDADVHAGVRWAGVRWAGVRWAWMPAEA